ncbi:MAG: hypothetical protein ABI575_11195 [Oxalobacteraceae bacterium]
MMVWFMWLAVFDSVSDSVSDYVSIRLDPIDHNRNPLADAAAAYSFLVKMEYA